MSSLEFAMPVKTLTHPIRASSGKYLDLSNFTPDDVNLEDINASLNYIYRFTGHHKNRAPLTVAQHTKLTTIICDMVYPNEPDVKFDCLIHDFPEYVTGDVTTNTKKILGSVFKAYEKHVEQVVYDKLWIRPNPFTEEIYQKRKVCDLLSLDIERRSMWDSQTGKDNWPDTPKIIFMNLEAKQALFDEIQAERFIDLIEMYNTLGKA